MELTQRRRVVYTALKPFFNETELQVSLQLLNEIYAEKQAFGLNTFVSKCCKATGHLALRAEIFRSFVATMRLPAYQLLADPDFSPELSSTLQANPDEKTLAFCQFSRQLLSLVDSQTQRAIHMSLLQLARSQSMAPTALHLLQKWLDEPESSLTINLAQPVLQILINQMYITLCEAFGPVEADQKLAKAIVLTEKNTENLSFNIRGLL